MRCLNVKRGDARRLVGAPTHGAALVLQQHVGVVVYAFGQVGHRVGEGHCGQVAVKSEDPLDGQGGPIAMQAPLG